MEERIRILAVDDDKLVRMNLGLTLGREGFEVDLASCLADALPLLAGQKYELVLTDLGLPDGTGLDVIDAARRADPDVKTIVVTGSQSSPGVEEATAAGAEAIVLKPFKLCDLLSEIRRALGAAQPPGDLPSAFGAGSGEARDANTPTSRGAEARGHPASREATTTRGEKETD